MRDPIEELENFTVPGPAMNPLPAAEVRRRGTRMRRRNNAIVAAGSLAVVAAIVTPVAVLAGHQTSSAPVPPANRTEWRQDVPAGLDLTAVPPGSAVRFTVNRNGAALDDITLCGKPAFSTRSDDPAGPAVDTAGASWGEAGSEGSTARTVAVYPDDVEASAALDGLRRGVLDCPEEKPPGNGLPLVHDRVDVTVPSTEESFVYTSQTSGGGLVAEMTVFEVARVGNALYLASSYSTAGGPQAAGNVQVLLDESAPVVDQLCVFSAAGCATPSGDAVDNGTSATAIPDDFPLLDGLPTAAATRGFGRFGPNRDAKPVGIVACDDEVVATPQTADLLRAGWTDPAEERQRQLMTFADEQSAQDYVELVRQAHTCPAQRVQAGVERVRSVVDAGLGDTGFVAVTRHVVRGRPGPGFRVTDVVRVGSAVLVSARVNDGDDAPVTDAVAQGLVDDSTAEIASVVDAMGELGS